MSRIFGILVAIPLACSGSAALAGKIFAVTPSGAAEMVFPDRPEPVIGKLSSKCIDVKWVVTSSSSTQLTCEAPLNMGQSVLGQLLMGNSYSTPPHRYFRFNAAEVNGVSRVQASGWMELQMAFGQTKRSDFSGAAFENGIMLFMASAGGKYPLGTTFPNHAMMGLDGDTVMNGKDEAIRIKKLDAGKPAADAGLRVGDIVTKIAGKTFKNTDGYFDAVARAAETPSYDVEFTRDGRPMKVTLNRAFRPAWTEAIVAAPAAQTSAPVEHGPSIADELIKLNKLKGDGVITAAEFEAQKRKLLGEQ